MHAWGIIMAVLAWKGIATKYARKRQLDIPGKDFNVVGSPDVLPFSSR
jgi:hypothetical protein